jgi:predicted nucleic acid-binding protein
MPDEIQPSTTLFIDANIFLYKILDHRKYAEPCSNLLKEISRGRYSGVVSVLVCSEVFIESCLQRSQRDIISPEARD